MTKRDGADVDWEIKEHDDPIAYLRAVADYYMRQAAHLRAMAQTASDCRIRGDNSAEDVLLEVCRHLARRVAAMESVSDSTLRQMCEEEFGQ